MRESVGVPRPGEETMTMCVAHLQNRDVPKDSDNV